MKNPAECDHEDFASSIIVNRFTDTGRFNAEIQIKCSECDTPFHFVGVPYGLSFKGPTASADGLELSIPIMPGPNICPPGTKLRYEMPGKNPEA